MSVWKRTTGSGKEEAARRDATWDARTERPAADVLREAPEPCMRYLLSGGEPTHLDFVADVNRHPILPKLDWSRIVLSHKEQSGIPFNIEVGEHSQFWFYLFEHLCSFRRIGVMIENHAGLQSGIDAARHALIRWTGECRVLLRTA